MHAYYITVVLCARFLSGPCGHAQQYLQLEGTYDFADIGACGTYAGDLMTVLESRPGWKALVRATFCSRVDGEAEMGGERI